MELEDEDQAELQQGEEDAAAGTASKADGAQATAGTTSAGNQGDEGDTSSTKLPKEQHQAPEKGSGTDAGGGVPTDDAVAGTATGSDTGVPETSLAEISTANGNMLSSDDRDAAPKEQEVQIDCPRCRQGANPRSHRPHAEGCPNKQSC